MEFKDRLKQQRLQRGVSQQKLADAIFVSRSAVAKWENGLGIPNETSYAALLTYFELTPEGLPLNEETEEISVSKNKTIRKLSVCVTALSIMMIATLVILFVNASKHGFGLTSKAAAGEQWRDSALYYHTEGYDFYANYLGNPDEGGVMTSFCAVRNQAVGYQRLDIG
ncbi:MAG: helix-turn-helix transcriptional regulator, partial [Clostridia bacterium]|nr:helix-turn-helix transcriptional regulator [Clostridia bacterium]